MSAYDSPQLLASLDSLEGVPDIFEPRLTPKKATGPQARAHDALGWLGVMLPGIGLAFLLAYLGYLMSEVAGGWLGAARGKSPVSSITLAVLLGLVIRNTIGVPKAYEPGLRLCIKTVLRLGIVILGLTLSLAALGRDVLWGLPVIVCCITAALVVVSLLNRALGLSRRLGTLIAVGTSVCGVSAIVATAPIIEAEEDETSYAVACITIFGLLALITYPFLAHAMFDPARPAEAGTFLGTAIHDTSQVAGAGMAYAQQFGEERVTKTAVTVKLVRNLSMSLLIPLMAVLYRRGQGQGGRRGVKQAWHQVVPLFVVGFVLMAAVRSLGDAGDGRAFGLVDRADWAAFCEAAKGAVPWLLATAMAAVGLGTGLTRLRELGLKPFTVGLAAAVLVGVVSTVLIKIISPFMR